MFPRNLVFKSLVLEKWLKLTTRPSFQTEKIESKDVRSAIDKYLNFGEWVMDQSIAVMGSSSYFERKR